MAQPTKHNDDSETERVIEFDMFVRDLEPEEKENVRAGGKPPQALENTDRRQ